jgi:hypothetical protein
MATRKIINNTSVHNDFSHLLDGYNKNASGRVFLSEQKKFAQIPDLLSLQKK